MARLNIRFFYGKFLSSSSCIHRNNPKDSTKLWQIVSRQHDNEAGKRLYGMPPGTFFALDFDINASFLKKD